MSSRVRASGKRREVRRNAIDASEIEDSSCHSDGASLHYEGSLTVSSDLAELVELREFEKILVGNLSNGERFETYVIYGESQKSLIELNGATAHLGKIGDRITIMNFGSYSAEEAARQQPRILVLDEKNRVARQEGIEPSLKVVGE